MSTTPSTSPGTGDRLPPLANWSVSLRLIGFFVLAFVLSWGVGAIFKGVPIVSPDGLFVAGVGLAAVIVLAVTEGRPGLKDLGRRLVRWRVGVRWYAVVLVVPVVLVGAVSLLLPLFGGGGLDWARRPELGATALLFAILLLLPLAAPIGEEIGWRGYALPRLLTRRSALTASLIIGVVWALWHLPVVLSDPALRVPVPFMLQVVPLSVLFTWLFLRTKGSLLIAVLFHAWFDVVLQFAAAMINPVDYQLMWWLLLGMQTVAAAAVVAAGGLRAPQQPAPAGPGVATGGARARRW